MKVNINYDFNRLVWFLYNLPLTRNNINIREQILLSVPVIANLLQLISDHKTIFAADSLQMTTQMTKNNLNCLCIVWIQ